MKKENNFYGYTLFAILQPILLNSLLDEFFCEEVIYTKGIPLDGIRKYFFLTICFSFIFYCISILIIGSIKNGYFKDYKHFLKKFILSPFFYVWGLTILISTGVLSETKGFTVFSHIILVITEIIFIHTNYKNKKN